MPLLTTITCLIPQAKKGVVLGGRLRRVVTYLLYQDVGGCLAAA